MRSLITGVVVAGAVAIAAAAVRAQSAEDAFGTWRHPDNGSHVQLYKCGEGLCAKIVKVQDGQTTDDKNPDAAKRTRPIVGLVVMSGAKKSGDTAWQGSLYDRSSGNTFAGTITVKSKSQIDLQGCTAVVLCKTTTWTRI